MLLVGKKYTSPDRCACLLCRHKSQVGLALSISGFPERNGKKVLVIELRYTNDLPNTEDIAQL